MTNRSELTERDSLPLERVLTTAGRRRVAILFGHPDPANYPDEFGVLAADVPVDIHALNGYTRIAGRTISADYRTRNDLPGQSELIPGGGYA